MPEFNSIADLERYINQQISSALEKEVADEARKTMQEKVQTEVYDRYTPTQYERTGALLKDVETHLISDNILEVEDTRKDEDNGRLIAPVVESGVGYEWTDSQIYKSKLARPFIEETAKELENGLAKEALKRGLIRQGLNVE